MPFADTEELVRNSSLPSGALVEVGTEHRLADPKSLAKMLVAVEGGGLIETQHELPVWIDRLLTFGLYSCAQPEYVQFRQDSLRKMVLEAVEAHEDGYGRLHDACVQHLADSDDDVVTEAPVKSRQEPLQVENYSTPSDAMPKPRPSKDIDEYIARFPDHVRAILQEVRTTIRTAAPEATETISYQMPAFKQHGILVYFAGWQKHIGLYPPVSGNKALEKAVARYTGPKGNLQFPLDQPIPYDLIERIVKLRVKQDSAKAAVKRKKRR